MCGIVGYISRQDYEKELECAIEAMIHRGPDNQQKKLLNFGQMKMGIGHLRLSILDLDPRSNQPFCIDNEQYIIIFNGEIYNYRILKNELIKQGITFVTNSDTEVFIQAYKFYGIECLKKFNGIFSAFIIDKVVNKAYLVRDQIGVKPVYYFLDRNNNFFFASELKALFKFSKVKQKISPADICQYINMAYLFEPRTGFEDVNKVKPGTYLEFNQSGNITQTEYYKPTIADNCDMDAVDEKIKHATIDQSMADVPVALLYSGGLDSSVLARFLGKDTKCLFFESSKKEILESGMADDKFYATKIADKLNLDLEMVKSADSAPENFLKEIEHIAKMVEEPISDYTFIASERLCKKAREKGYKVVMSGMGGDEAFAGYPRHLLAKYHFLFKGIKYLLLAATPFISILKKYEKKVDRLKSFLLEKSFNLGYIHLIGFFSSNEIRGLIKNKDLQDGFEKYVNNYFFQENKITPLKKALLLDFSCVLAHNLLVADKSSMLASVEMRVPLLDLEVYQSGISLPDNELINKTKQKCVLQKILKKEIPNELVSRPKAGFNPPLDERINRLGFAKTWEILSKGQLGDFLNLDIVHSIIMDHFDNKKNNAFKIYQFLFLDAWIRVWTKKIQ
ncbi:MAG: asparagine synthase (glutamine-hydrolyzing) [Emcibacteraceae bacterium]